jgi:putative two-component system response regulator
VVSPRTEDGVVGGRTPAALIDAARSVEDKDPAAARLLLQQARVLARSAHDGSTEADALFRLAWNAHLTGNNEEALTIALDALTTARRCDTAQVEVRALNLISGVHFDAGNFGEALAQSLVALERTRTAELHDDEAKLLNTVAAIHHAMRDLDRAIVMYEAALSASHGSEEIDAVTLGNMSRLRAERQEYLLAVSLGEAALALSHKHPRSAAGLCAHLASVYLAIDDTRQAENYLLKARDLQVQSPSPDAAVGVAFVESKLLVRYGRHGDARNVLLRALDEVVAAHVAELELDCHRELYELNKQLDDPAAALHHHERMHTLSEEIFSRGQDLRIKTLQITHDTESARSQAEILRLRSTELEELVRGRTGDLEDFQLGAFQRLAALAEFRDLDSGEHSLRVGELSASIAEEIREQPEYVQRVRIAGRLHDIGKLGVPDEVLMKSSPLTDQEFELMKQHTIIGSRLMEGSTSPVLQLASEAALAHHEWYDGSGYPYGLAGSAIPLSGRIVAIADVYDALTSERPYKPAWTPSEAFAYIWAASGSHFDPRLVEAFVRVLAREEPEALDRPPS